MQQNPFVWAHRGASGLAPENTMAAFRLAEQVGADGIELDVHLSRDVIPVVMHDETIDRTTSGHGAVADNTWRTLRSLDAGSWFAPEYAGAAVPTLAEVLTWVDDRMRVNIEIKSARAGHAVLELLHEFPRARVLISSFHHDLLITLRQHSPTLPLGVLIDSRFWRHALKHAIACQAESFHPPVRHVTHLMINSCHRRGLAVFPWTVDTVSRQRSLLRIGVDGWFTNFPAGLNAADNRLQL